MATRRADVQIRRAESDDADAAVEIMLAARHAAVPSIPRLIHRDDEVRDWFKTIVMTVCEVWIATIDGRAAALLALDGNEIEHLYAAPGSTDVGLGSALVDQAKSIAGTHLELWTFASNHGARRFYERHGFVQIGATDGDNEEGEPDIRYRWQSGREVLLA